MSRSNARENGIPFSDLRLTTPPQFFYWNREYRWQPPPLPDYDFWCIMEGRGTVRLHAREYTLSQGCCFVLAPGDQPDARHDPSHPLVAFFCHFDMLDRRGRRMPPHGLQLPPPGLQARDPDLLASVAQRCVAAHRRNDPLGLRQSRVLLEDMLLLVWEWAFGPQPRPSDPQIADAVRAVERQPGRDWTVREMAAMAHLSKSQFTRRFDTLVGVPPMAFVIRTRLNLARQLIRETGMKLTHIAAELGYSDVYFFSRQFRQHFGRPPGAFRREIKCRGVAPPLLTEQPGPPGQARPTDRPGPH